MIVDAAERTHDGLVEILEALLDREERRLLERVAAREVRGFFCDVRVTLRAGRVVEVLCLRREVRRLIAESLLRRTDARRLIERRVESGINFVKCRGNRTLVRQVDCALALAVRQTEALRREVANLDIRIPINALHIDGLTAIEKLLAIVCRRCGIFVNSGNRLVNALLQRREIDIAVRVIRRIEERRAQARQHADRIARCPRRRIQHGVGILRVRIRLIRRTDVRIRALENGIAGRTIRGTGILRARRDFLDAAGRRSTIGIICADRAVQPAQDAADAHR